MQKILKYSICRPLKGISKSWHILVNDNGNSWYPIAYVHPAKKHDKKKFQVLLEHIAKSGVALFMAALIFNCQEVADQLKQSGIDAKCVDVNKLDRF